MHENLVSFPASPLRVSPAVAHACAVFLERWNGSDVTTGARELSDLLPEHVPGPLKLVILRALRQLDVPAFPSAEAFRAAVSRFAVAVPELLTIADVRRARREHRVTLKDIAAETALPVYMLRQLEWGDFRQWHNAEWSERVTRAYAHAARLDPDRVVTIVDEERRAQRAELVVPVHDVLGTVPADAVPLHGQPVSLRERSVVGRRAPRARSARRFGFAAAAVGMFVAGLGVGGTIVQQHALRSDARQSVQPPQPPPSAAIAQPAAPMVSRGTAPAVPPAPAAQSEAPPSGDTLPASEFPAADDTAANTAQAEPPLLTASTGGAPAFSPAFSSVGGAVFYHRDEGVGTALVKADRDETTGDLRVINIVEDGARNYHVRPSPDGSMIAFDSDRDGERGVYVANADGTGVRRVSGSGFAAVPSWSPDGTMLAFVRAEQDPRTWNLWLLNLKTSETRRVTSYQYGQPWGASWFPDGRRVAYSHEDRLTVLDLPTGTKRMFKTPRAGRLVRTPAVSPDGQHIAFQVLKDGAWLLDLRDGSMQRILADPTAEEFAWDSTGHRLAFHSRRSGTWSVWIMAGPES